MRFEPICYEHAARLINRSPREVSRNAELLAEAHLNAMDRYGLKGCVVGIDIYNVEAEAYGCTVIDSGESDVPSIASPLVSSVDDLRSLTLDPEHDGRMPLVFDAARIIAKAKPGAEVRIPLCGPFTIACQLIGMENFIWELFMNPGPAVKAMLHLADNQLKIGTSAREAGFEVALFESSVTPPLLSPVMFRDCVAPALVMIINGLNHDGTADTQLIIGGDTIHILDTIFTLKPNYIICPAESDQPAFMDKTATGSCEMTIRVNLNPKVFLQGNEGDARAEARRVKELAGRFPRTTTGCLIPFDADPTIIDAIAEFMAQ